MGGFRSNSCHFDDRFFLFASTDFLLAALDANEFWSVRRNCPAVSEAINKELGEEIVLIEQSTSPRRNADKKASWASFLTFSRCHKPTPKIWLSEGKR